MVEQIPDTPPSSPNPPKRLHRSSSRKMFLGICGGLGDYFSVDPTMVRLLFAAGTILGGSTVVLYAVLAAIMPAENALDLDPRDAARQTMDEAGVEIQQTVEKVIKKIRETFGLN